MNFKGRARRLDDLDLPRIGLQIKIGEDELHAVLDVETRGGGFFKDGRIKMLPERHIFYKELGPGAERDAAVRQGLAYKKWGTKPYPKSADARYDLLRRMMQINPDAALRSCSWGLGQIMGFNHNLAGYTSAEAMVRAFVDDEEIHLEAMVNFIASTGLDDELRRHDWRGFAKGYNGPGYAKNAYHTKLAAAFKRWQAIPDTPFEIDRVPEDPVDTIAVKRKEKAQAGSAVAAAVAAAIAAGIKARDWIVDQVAEVICAVDLIAQFQLVCGGLNL